MKRSPGNLGKGKARPQWEGERKADVKGQFPLSFGKLGAKHGEGRQTKGVGEKRKTK